MGANRWWLAHRVAINFRSSRILPSPGTGRRFRFRGLNSNHDGDHLSIRLRIGLHLVSYALFLAAKPAGKFMRLLCLHRIPPIDKTSIANRLRLGPRSTSDNLVANAARYLGGSLVENGVVGDPCAYGFRHCFSVPDYGCCPVAWATVNRTPYTFSGVRHDSRGLHSPI